MQEYQYNFIRYAIDCNVLRFGQFTLKSGRTSPYFFNTGLFNTGTHLDQLGRYYAQALSSSGLHYDLLYGPAYKGIPLACATSIAISQMTNKAVPFTFNRKEAKDHGEGGHLVGAPLQGKVIIVDDVITAGTSVRESMQIIQAAGASACGVLISLDRQERGHNQQSAIDEVQQQFNISVVAIISLQNIIDYLMESKDYPSELAAIQQYQDQYGSN